MKITSDQLVTCATPSRISKPAGVCIQLFSARIQNAEIVVPMHTSSVAMVCMRGLTRLMPNSMIPRKVASMKKAVSVS